MTTLAGSRARAPPHIVYLQGVTKRLAAQNGSPPADLTVNITRTHRCGWGRLLDARGRQVGAWCGRLHGPRRRPQTTLLHRVNLLHTPIGRSMQVEGYMLAPGSDVVADVAAAITGFQREDMETAADG